MFAKTSLAYRLLFLFSPPSFPPRRHFFPLLSAAPGIFFRRRLRPPFSFKLTHMIEIIALFFCALLISPLFFLRFDRGPALTKESHTLLPLFDKSLFAFVRRWLTGRFSQRDVQNLRVRTHSQLLRCGLTLPNPLPHCLLTKSRPPESQWISLLPLRLDFLRSGPLSF